MYIPRTVQGNNQGRELLKQDHAQPPNRRPFDLSHFGNGGK